MLEYDIFKAGFRTAIEGWNGEYPMDGGWREEDEAQLLQAFHVFKATGKTIHETLWRPEKELSSD